MNEILEWLNQNQWLNLIFLTLAILSIVVSIYLYRKSRKRKRPVFDLRSTNVISENIKNLGEIDVKFKGEQIENLTVTKLALWNSGNDTINETDQAPTDLLTINLSDGYNVLEAEVIFQSESTNNISLEIKESSIGVEFDYFDGNQGGIIKVVHTGKKSSDLNLKGTFKGSEKLKRIHSRLYNIGVLITLPFFNKLFDSEKEKRIISRLFPWIVLITGIGIGSAYFLVDAKTSDRIFFIVMGSIYTILGLLLVFGRTTMPKGFEVFFDDE